MTTVEELTLDTGVWPDEDADQSVDDAMVTMVPGDRDGCPVLPPRRVRPYVSDGQRMAEGRWEPVGIKVTVWTCRVTPDDGETQVYEMAHTPRLRPKDGLVIACEV